MCRDRKRCNVNCYIFQFIVSTKTYLFKKCFALPMLSRSTRAPFPFNKCICCLSANEHIGLEGRTAMKANMMWQQFQPWFFPQLPSTADTTPTMLYLFNRIQQDWRVINPNPLTLSYPHQCSNTFKCETVQVRYMCLKLFEQHLRQSIWWTAA